MILQYLYQHFITSGTPPNAVCLFHSQKEHKHIANLHWLRNETVSTADDTQSVRQDGKTGIWKVGS